MVEVKKQFRPAPVIVGALTGQGQPWGWHRDPDQRAPWMRRPWVWRVVGAAFLLWLVPDANTLWHSPHGLIYRVLVLCLLALFCLVYLAVWPDERRPSPSLRWWLVLVALGLTLCGLLGPGSIGVSVYVLISGAATLPTRQAFLMLWVAMAGIALYTGLSDLGPQWAEVVIFGSITLMMIALMSNVRAIRELRAAREEVARLAVAEERNRMARDLHDVLGHSLTTITVKSALARRLTESGDTVRAAAEITDVERLSRQMLTDVRATVSAQRQATLPAELAGARAVLTAAGIEAVLPQATEDVRAEYRETFAYVLREAVTNVVRHSGARRCEVRLGAYWVEVCDDGIGCLRSNSGVQLNGGVQPNGGGSGLVGVRERLAPLGGSLQLGAGPGGGFRLRATVEDR